MGGVVVVVVVVVEGGGVEGEQFCTVSLPLSPCQRYNRTSRASYSNRPLHTVTESITPQTAQPRRPAVAAPNVSTEPRFVLCHGNVGQEATWRPLNLLNV